MEGFTYNGIHSSQFSLWYIPDDSERMNSVPDYEVAEDEVAGRNGGYYYGSRVKQREFSLSCFFEDINLETKERMMRWQDRSTSGQLVFDSRPFVYYNVRPTKKPEGKIYASRQSGSLETAYNGTITITFTAYDPFGYLAYNSYDGIDVDGAGRYCDMLEKTQMPSAPTPSSSSFFLYNCGTQPCATIFRIGGTAPNGQTITNNLNGQKCSVVELPPTSRYLEINSHYGTVELATGTTKEIVFEYHNDGFITLEPNGTLYGEVQVAYTKGSNKATMFGVELTNDLVGKYVYLNGAWTRIIYVSADGTVTLNKSMTSTGVDSSTIITLNEIEISGTGYSLNKLEVEYMPMVN